MSDEMIAVVVTAVLVVGLLAWGAVVHFCCEWKFRRALRRAATDGSKKPVGRAMLS